MTTQITLIGLDQISISIGLALAKHKEFRRVGHDRDTASANKAAKMGALDRVEINIPNALREAQIVILSLPVNETAEMMEFISTELKPGVVVMETGPAKVEAVNWAQKYLSPENSFVGLAPAVNPKYFDENRRGLDGAHADLFEKSMIGIITPQNARAEAINMAVNLTNLLGASPFFTEAAEVDGFSAAIDLLPTLLGAALANTTTSQPGWRDGRKLAGQSLAASTRPLTLGGEPAALAAAALYNRENARRLLEQTASILLEMSAEIDKEDLAALKERFDNAQTALAIWMAERQAENYAGDSPPLPTLPSTGEVYGRMFSFGRRKSSPTDKK